MTDDDIDNKYGFPVLDEYNQDDGTMLNNATEFADAIIGHRIVEIVHAPRKDGSYWASEGTTFVLDNGTRVSLRNTSDCCAHTELQGLIHKLPMIDHIITSVRIEDDYSSWFIIADLGDVLELDVSWSPGNPFYYGYGFHIEVEPAEDDA